MSRIYVDIQSILKSRSGIGWYSYNILNNMKKTKDMSMYAMIFDFLGRNKTDKNINLPVFDGLMINAKIPLRIYKALWGPLLFKYDSIFKNGDIYHFLNFIVPPISAHKKVVINIYDMVYKILPQTMKASNLYLLNKHLGDSIKRADRIITISQSAKNDILRFFDLDEKKISVIPPGTDYDLFNAPVSIHAQNEIRQKYNLPDKYFLYLGTIEPRKNIETIFKAYSELPEDIREGYKLVIAGGVGWKAGNILELPGSLGIEENVVFTGYVSEEDKPALYKMAKAFIFPSLYEGFGMPVIEALASGVPCVAADNSSLMEAGGDAAFYAGAKDWEAMACHLINIVNDISEVKTNIEKGRLHARKFSWESSAEKTLEVYRDIMGEGTDVNRK